MKKYNKNVKKKQLHTTYIDNGNGSYAFITKEIEIGTVNNKQNQFKKNKIIKFTHYFNTYYLYKKC